MIVWSHGEEDRRKYPHCPHILESPQGMTIMKDAKTGQMCCVPCVARLQALGLFPKKDRVN